MSLDTELAMFTDTNSSSRCLPRSRSSSITGPASPESQSSDSPSSSDPDTHILFSNTTTSKSLFAMDVDTSSNPHMMSMETDVPFNVDFELRQVGVHGLQSMDAFHGYDASLDNITLNGPPNMNTNTKADMLMLEEIIQDDAFEPSSTIGQPFQSRSSRSPAFRELYIPLPPPLDVHSHLQLQPDPVCIDPSSTQQKQSRPHLQATSPSSSAVNAPSLFKTEPSSVLLLSPASQTASGASTPLIPDLPSAHRLLPYYPTPFALVSNEVVHPHKNVCVDLPIFFPSVPTEGTKSRVETQIKLTFELGFPISTSSSPCHSLCHERTTTLSSSQSKSSASSTSNSPSASPALSRRDVSDLDGNLPRLPTHDKVGTYRFIRLPQGTATKRRVTSIAGAQSAPEDVKVEDTLDMTAEVMCCSSPYALVQSCSSCQSREAKRTARKLAARVRPIHGVRSKARTKKCGKKGREQDFDAAQHGAAVAEEIEDEPNADASIIQFNCAEIIDFGCGSVVLPMRITCYCRHHKEKIGFSIVFTLRDYVGRIVGRGTTPPILITDDHKSNNAVSKLPPMHPLRQALNPPLMSPSSLATADRPEETKSLSSQSTQDHGVSRTLARRRDTDSPGKKRRPKPYDGRPMSRTSGVGPGIEGRHGVVLALHPAHAKVQTSVAKGGANRPMDRSGETTTPPDVESPTSPAQRAGSLPAPVLPEKSPPSPSPSLSGTFTPQSDMNILALEPDVGFSHHTSPVGLASFLPTTSPSPSLPSPSSSKSEYQITQPPMQSPPNLETLSSAQQTSFISSSPPLYPSLTPAHLPKIHRLIPSSGPTTGGIEITILGSNFHTSLPLECVFGGAIASSTHRWSDSTLVCVLPPRVSPGIVGVEFKSIKGDGEADGGGACLFNYVDESDRQLMELALQVVGLKMTGKIEEARSVAMRIVGNTNTPTPAMTNGEILHMNSLSGAQFAHHSFLGSLSGMDLETLIIKLLTLLDVPAEAGVTIPLASCAIGHQNATGQTLLHLAVILALPALVSCLTQRSIDLDARNTNGLTALHFAAMTGWKEGVKILLAAGADASIVDGMGFTPIERARCARSHELEKLLEEANECDSASECGGGEEGDDEAWNSEDEASEDGRSDVGPFPSATSPPQYISRSRMVSPAHTDSSPEDLSDPEEQQRKNPPAQIEMTPSDVPTLREFTDEKRPVDDKQGASFVGRLQRTLPQGILPNVQIPGLPHLQIPGFPQLQLSDMLAGPWGAFPQISVFPVFVPMPNLPHLPNWPAFSWTDGGKKESRPGDETEEKQQQPFPMLWAAYDNIANNAWRAQWEKWTAHVTALQNANSPSTELPPVYTPRETDKQPQSEPQMTADPKDNAGSFASSDIAIDTPVASTSRPPAAKATRRMGYFAVKVPDTEVNSYHYQPKKKFNHKKDRMLVLFWIPILFIGLAYALYITLPAAVAGVSRATKRLIPHLPQRDETPV